jgi:membrane carboxypeptidase/penicillin-binding protein
LLLATAIVIVNVTAWLFIRADLQAARAAIRSSAAADVPMTVLNAFIAAEDPCHWKHRRTHTLATITGMFVANDDHILSELDGHASLANQLVRHHVNGRGLSRQVREVLVTAVIEATYNPATIARAYANSVYLGTMGRKHIYGVTDAARTYYGKRTSQLNLAECVTLAASIRSPRIYSSGVQSERAVIRRLSVLSRLRESGFASPQDFATAERKLRRTAG